jgi:hypothetical protein
MNIEKTIVKLQKQFPDIWFKDGADFSNSHKGTIWTGEGSYIDGYSAFSYYDSSNTMGIHPKFEEALNKLGLWAEFYDPGTVFLYKD